MSLEERIQKMKRLLIVLCAMFLLIVPIAGCGKGSGSGDEKIPENAQGSGKDTDFRVGYARAVITPNYPVPLAGYGNTERRMSDGFLDDICVTCVAVSGTNNETLLWFTSDLINIRQNELAVEIKNDITEATGIPFENINLCYTHTHSSVDLEKNVFERQASVRKFYEDYRAKCLSTALEALSDREPVEKMEYGISDLTGFNFVKHYYTDKDEVVGDNHGGYATGTVNRHTTDSNHNMYLLRFNRASKKPVVLATFRAHPILTGGSDKKDISADYVGALRMEIEKGEDCLFAFYQGEAGNHNAKSRLQEENDVNGCTTSGGTDEYLQWGENAYARVKETLAKDMKEVAMGPVYTDCRYVTLDVNHLWDADVAIARELSSYFTSTNDRNGIWAMCYEHGIESPYHASAIVSRSVKPKTQDVEINAAILGDFIMVCAPFETFHTNGDYIRANSPSEYHFVFGYSNESNGYLPSSQGYSYGCYEADTSTFAPGSGEILADAEVEMIKDLWKKKTEAK